MTAAPPDRAAATPHNNAGKMYERMKQGMEKTLQRLLSFALAVLMVFSCVPTSALATDLASDGIIVSSDDAAINQDLTEETDPPVVTTEAPVETTEAPVETTEAPVEETVDEAAVQALIVMIEALPTAEVVSQMDIDALEALTWDFKTIEDAYGALNAPSKAAVASAWADYVVIKTAWEVAYKATQEEPVDDLAGEGLEENKLEMAGVEDPVAKIGDTGYATLADALTAAKTMTGNVTVEIYDKVTLNAALTGSFDSIEFVGMDTDAEIYLDVQGYITATGKKVAFEDLTLSKSEGGYIANAGFMNLAFGIYDVAEVTYTDCTFTNGAYASSGKVTFDGCTFYRSHDRYGMWVYGDVEAIVDGCTFDDFRGIKLYSEGMLKEGVLTVKNTDFRAVDNKPAIVLTSGERITLEGNTYSSTGVFELDLDGVPNGTPITSDVLPTCINDYGACGVLVDGKIYTTVAQAAEVATSGSTVTLLHDSAEIVELPEGVTLDKNGFPAAGVTVEAPVTAVAKIGETKYETLAAAINAAQAGNTVTVIADIANEAVTVDKNLTITGNKTLTNVSISGSTGIELTVSGLTFTGNSWINTNGAAKLTVSGVTANVNPSNTTATNSRSAFISLGRSEQATLELVVENSNIVAAGGANPILGWAAITKATLTGNTFGSATAHQNNSDSVKFMSIADGAVFTITGNTIYSDYNGIVFGQNTTRGNAYTAVIEDNTFVGSADHIWVEVSGATTCNGNILATSDNKINGNPFTASDIKLHPNLKTFTGILAVDAEFDNAGKLIGGTFTKEPAAGLIAEGYVYENGSVIAAPGLKGSGTAEDPFLIEDLDDLIWFRDSVNTYTSDGSNQYKGQYVKLTADIDLAGIDWTPIGTNSVGDHMAFLGTFDGDGHTISNLSIYAADDHLGFFARTGSFNETQSATVKNITFHNVDVASSITNSHGGSYVGGVIANSGGNTTVSNVKLTGDIYVEGYGYVGGIVGHGYPKMDNCHVTANDGSYVMCHYWCGGGIIGYAGEGGTRITNCSVSGLEIWSAYGAGGAVAGLLNAGNTLTNVSASNVEISSASDYIMGYIAGNGEESTLTNVTASNVTATANGKEITSTDAVAKVDGAVYFSLAEAIAAAQNGDTVTLLADLVIDSETYTIPDGVSITLDMNGKKITATDNKAANVSYELFYIYGGLTVTGNGTIELTSTSNDTAWAKSSTIFHNRGGVLTVVNGTFKHNGGTNMAYVIDNSANSYGDAVTTVTGGTLTSTYIAIRNRMESVGANGGGNGIATLNVKGGTISGTSRAIWAQASSSTEAAPATGAINISGGDIGLIDTARNATAQCMTTISGGTVAGFKGEVGELTVKNGATAPTELTILNASGAAVDYKVDADGKYVEVKYVAEVNGTKYETLAAALAVGGTIELLADVTENIEAIENVTLTTNVAGGVTVTNTSTDWVDFNGVTVKSGVTLDISNVYSDGDDSVNVIEGTMSVGTYYNSHNAKTTVQNGGKIATTGMFVNRYHTDPDAGVYIYGDGDDSTVEFSSGDTIGTYSGTFYAEDAVVQGKMLWMDYWKNGSGEADTYAQADIEFVDSIVNVTSEFRLYKDASLTLTNTTVTAGKVQVRENATPVVNVTNSTITAASVENLAGAAINAIRDENGNITFKVYVAKIGNVGYESLAAAINAAQAGDTITLLQDVKLTGKLTIGKAITIDGNGHSITADETAVWYTVSGKLNIKNYKIHLLGINASGIVLKDVVLDCNNNAAGINVYCAQNVVFDNVSIINATKGQAALTVNGSTVTFKTAFTALGNSIALDISNGSGVTSALGVTVESGTVFDLGNKIVKFASVADTDMTAAVDANGNPYFAAMDNAYYYTDAQMESRTNAYSNGLTLLTDVDLEHDLQVRITLNLNDHDLTIVEGKALKITGNTTVTGTGEGEIDADIVLTGRYELTAPEGLDVTTSVAGCKVIYQDGKYRVVDLVYVAEVNGTKYETLAEAIAAAQDGDVITVLADIELTEAITVPYGKTVTLDLAGKIVSHEMAQTGNYSMITNDGNLTIQDTVGKGAIIYTDLGNGGEYVSNTIMNRGTLIVNSGSIINKSSATVAMNGYPYAIDTSIWGTAAEVNTIINGGTVTCEQYSAIRMRGDSATEAVNVTVTGGEINGTIEVQNSSNVAVGKLTVTGGTIKNSATANALFVFGSTGSTAMEVAISGGTWTGNLTIKDSIGTGFDKGIVSGGYFDQPVVKEHCAEGFVPTQIDEDTYSVRKANYVAEVDGTKYETLAEAFAAADGETVKLLTDIVLTEGVTVAKGNTVTLDLAGHTVSAELAELPASFALITNKGTLTVQDSATGGKLSVNYTGESWGYGKGLYTISNEGGTLNIAGGRVENLTSVSGSMYDAIDNNSTLGNTVLNISGGEISCGYLGIRQFANSTTYANTVNVTGGKIEGGNSAIWTQNPGSAQPKADIVISSGYVTGRILLGESEAFGVAVSGGTFTVEVPEEFCAKGFIPADNGDGTYGVKVGSYVAQIGETKYETLAEAIAAADGKTVTLLADVEQTESISIPNGKTVTLELNGHTITGTDNSNGSFGLINNNGNLTINDSVGTGKITLIATIDRDFNAYSSVISNNPGGKLTVNGGTIEHLGGSDMAYAIDNLTNGKGTSAVTVINGGTVKSPYRAIRQFLNGVEAQNILTVNAGTVEGGNKAIWVQDPSKNANTGDITVGANAKINGDIYLTGTAGSEEWPVKVAIAQAAMNGDVLTNNLPDGYVLENNNGTWSVDHYVAYIYTIRKTYYYKTLAEAVADRHQDEIIVMIDDCVLTKTVKIPENKEIIIDLNGKTIDGIGNVNIALMSYGNLTIRDTSAEQTGTIKAGIGTGGNAINICAGTFVLESGNIYSLNNGILIDEEAAEVHIQAGTITAEPTTKNSSVFYISSTADTDLYISGGEMVGYNGMLLWNNTNISITGGSIEGKTGPAIQGNGSKDNTAISISGGTITGKEVGIYHPQGGTLTISGGEITGDTGIVVKGGTVTISGGKINGVGAAQDYAPKNSGFIGTGDALYVEHYDSSTNSENYGTPVITVTGGTFTSTNGKAVGAYANPNNDVEAPAKFISGGTFSNAVPKELCAVGYKPITYTSTTYGVTEVTYVAQIGEEGYESLAEAFAAAEDNDVIVMLANDTVDTSITNTKKVTLDLNGKVITGIDNSEKSFCLINNNGDLTIKDSIGTGKITLEASIDRDFNAYSSVISNNPGGKLTVNGGTIEHLGGSDMAYAIDNLTNGKGTSAVTVINGGTIKSPYRAIRQFLNGVEAINSLTVNGGTVEGENKAIWFQDPSKNANSGDITVGANAVINGDVYLSVTAGSTEWPVEIAIAEAAMNGEVLTNDNIPTGYDVAMDSNMIWGIVVELPEVVITDIADTLTENDPELTFALNYAIKDLDKLTESYLEDLMTVYGGYYVDYVLTISGLSEANVTFNANGNADGYLAGQYDAWSENWVTVPFEDVTIQNGQSLYIMEYAAKLLNQNGLRFTLAEIAEIVQNFDCGVYFTPEFLAANPGMKVDLTLKVFTEDENGNKTEIDVATKTFETASPVAAVEGVGYYTLDAAIQAAAGGKVIDLLTDLELSEVVTIPHAVNLNGAGHTITSTASRAINIDTTEEVIISNLTIVGGTGCERGINIINKAGTTNLKNVDISGISHYAVHVATSAGAAKVNIYDSELTGYGALAIYGSGTTATVSDSALVGINTYTGANSFSTVAVGGEKITVTVTGGSITASSAEGKAEEYIIGAIADQLTNSTIYLDTEVILDGENVNYIGMNVDNNILSFRDDYTAGIEAQNYLVTEPVNGMVTVRGQKVAAIDIGRNRFNYYVSLEEAVADAWEGDTIIVLQDIALKDTLVIPADKDITLDLNGNTISQTKACTEHYAMIQNNGSLTITDSVGEGKISFTDTGKGDPNFTWGAYTLVNEGTLVVNSGTIENLSAQNTATSVVHMYCAIQQANGSTTINGGTVATNNYRSVRVNRGSLTVNGGTMDGQIWIQPYDDSSSLTINGGSFAPAGADASSVYVENASKTVALSVTGGTFETKIGASIPANLPDAITGGDFTQAAAEGTNEAMVLEGFELADEDGDGIYNLTEVIVYVAEIKDAEGNSVKYETLEEAVDAAADGGVIELLATPELKDYAIVGKNLTIVRNGFTATVSALTGYTVLEDPNAYVVTSDFGTSEDEGAKVAYVDLDNDGVRDSDEELESLTAALNAATSGQTVRLTASLVGEDAEGTVIIPGGVTLNIDAFSLEAEYIIGLSGSKLDGVTVKSSDIDAKLYVPKDNLMLASEGAVQYDSKGKAYTVVPIYDVQSGCFRLARYEVTTEGENRGLVIDEEKLYFQFMINTTAKVRTDMVTDGVLDNELKYIVRIEWTTDEGTAYQDFVYSEPQIMKVYEGGWDYAVTIEGYQALGITAENVSVYGMVLADCGVQSISKPLPEK